jgi:hypothetical protein
MTKDEALRLTLDWLESGNFVYPTKIRNAIKEALEQSAQEPVDNDFFKVLARNNPSPDQRPWVGLTDDDYAKIEKLCLTTKQAAMSAAHILKEKNL